MSRVENSQIDARLQQAIVELRGMIAECYPDARFSVTRALDDPEAVHLLAIVDLEDTEELVDLVIDRMMELQIDEGLPLFVIPVRSPERVMALQASLEGEHASGPVPRP